MTPEYSPQMLALFLQAHAVEAAVRVQGIIPLGGAAPLSDEILRQREELRIKAGLKQSVFRCCWAGMTVSADNRRAAWRALGINPDIAKRKRS